MARPKKTDGTETPAKAVGGRTRKIDQTYTKLGTSPAEYASNFHRIANILNVIPLHKVNSSVVPDYKMVPTYKFTNQLVLRLNQVLVEIEELKNKPAKTKAEKKKIADEIDTLNSEMAKLETKIKEESHCDLCGMVIGYQYPMVHAGDPDFSKGKSMYVGSDCIQNYIREHIPQNVASQLIERMDLLIQEQEEDARAETFARDYPNFMTSLEKTREGYQLVLKKYEAWSVFSTNSAIKLAIFETYDKARSDYISKKYTSGPNADKIIAFVKSIDDGSFDEKIKEWSDNQKKGLTIQQELDKTKDAAVAEFYDLYIKTYVFVTEYLGAYSYRQAVVAKTFNSPALSKVEKKAYLDHMEDYQRARKKNKKQLVGSKDVVLTKLNDILVSRLKVEALKDSDAGYLFGSNYGNTSPVDKEEEKSYTHLCNLSSLSDYSIRSVCLSFNLKAIAKYAAKPSEDLQVQKLITEHNGKMVRSNSVVFKSEDEAQDFANDVIKISQKLIQAVESFIAEDQTDLYNENVY
jgi:hypothetical protein